MVFSVVAFCVKLVLVKAGPNDVLYHCLSSHSFLFFKSKK